MQRKAASEKILLLGLDGLDPKLTRKYVDKGLMPNTQKFIEAGAQRHDLVMLGGQPTVTPPMWTTLATGCYANVLLIWTLLSTIWIPATAKPNSCGMYLQRQAKKRWFGIGQALLGRPLRIVPICTLWMVQPLAVSICPPHKSRAKASWVLIPQLKS